LIIPAKSLFVELEVEGLKVYTIYLEKRICSFWY